MAHRRASIKKIRVDIKRRAQNVRVTSELRTALRNVLRLIAEKNAAEARKAATLATSKLDKAVKKGILHKNSASRQKARIALKLNSLKK